MLAFMEIAEENKGAHKKFDGLYFEVLNEFLGLLTNNTQPTILMFGKKASSYFKDMDINA